MNKRNTIRGQVAISSYLGLYFGFGSFGSGDSDGDGGDDGNLREGKREKKGIKKKREEEEKPVESKYLSFEEG